jgi:hypothetical protein
MKRIQLLQTADYWTQRKDTDAPAIECQVTSGANFLMALGLFAEISPRIPRMADGSMQRLPDWINDVTKSPEGCQLAAVDGWKGIPREDHMVLAWAINQVAGRVVNAFRWKLSLPSIFLEVARGRPVIVSGVFGQYRSVKDGQLHDRAHVVCLTGLETEQDDIESAPAVDLAKISAALIADPYGDFHTDYEDPHGAECRFTVAELAHILHDQGQATKWGHIYVDA